MKMPSLVHNTNGPDFDYVQTIEAMLQDAKKLAAVTPGGGAATHDHQSSKTAKENETKLRRKIAMTAKKIAFEVGDPADVARSKWVELADVGATNLFIDWKVFDHIPLDDPAGISVHDLAEVVGAEESLIERISNLLISTSTLQPSPSSTASSLRLTHSRISPLYRSTHPFSPLVTVAVGNGMRPYAHWPSYFRTYSRTEPAGVSHTPFSYSWGHPDLEPWAVKALHPEYARQFERSMQSRDITGYLKLVGAEALYDFSWVGEVAARQRERATTTGHNPNDKISRKPVVVDVGGGLGQLLHDIIREIPGIEASQCVLQDRKEVIEAAISAINTTTGDNTNGEMCTPVMKGLIAMEHDFHQPQPIRNATVYFLRRILLDYPDHLAVGILKHLADALPAPVDGTEDDLGEREARVFIMEPSLMDSTGPGPVPSPNPMNRIVDMVMLNIGGKLRNEKMYRHLATAAGLKVVGYYTREGDPAVVVECVKA